MSDHKHHSQLENNERLLRPLHRRRTRQRTPPTILNTTDLMRQLGLPREQLETYLQERQIRYHKDSRGELWLSWPNPSITEPPPDTL